MAASGLKEVVPYAVNFSVVLVLVTVMARKPLQRFVYQRHERLRDFVDASAKVFKAAKERYESASLRLGSVADEEKEILASEVASARKESAELLAKGNAEAERLKKEAERLVSAEQSEIEQRVRIGFLDSVLASAELRLKKNLKNDDHKKILKSAQSRIEVGQNG